VLCFLGSAKACYPGALGAWIAAALLPAGSEVEWQQEAEEEETQPCGGPGDTAVRQRPEGRGSVALDAGQRFLCRGSVSGGESKAERPGLV
jgi:hypothetical protein